MEAASWVSFMRMDQKISRPLAWQNFTITSSGSVPCSIRWPTMFTLSGSDRGATRIWPIFVRWVRLLNPEQMVQ